MERFLDLIRANPLPAAFGTFFLLVVFLAWRIELGGSRKYR